MSIAKAGAALLLLSLGACTSVPIQNTATNTDDAYINAVNQQAAMRGVSVIWLTYPTKSEVKRQ